MSRATPNRVLATIAFALCFTAWSLIAPFAKTFKDDLGLSYTEALLLTAVPVIEQSGRNPHRKLRWAFAAKAALVLIAVGGIAAQFIH